MAREYRVISADSHLEVPVWKWTDRIPSKIIETERPAGFYCPKAVTL